MMFQLGDDFLKRLGLAGMPEEEKEAFLSFVYEELEMRIGTVLSKDLSDDQLLAFEKLVDDNKQDAIMQWLREHCSNYEEVVKQELEKLEVEIMNSRDQLLGDVAA